LIGDVGNLIRGIGSLSCFIDDGDDFFISLFGGDVVVVEDIKHSNFSEVVFPYILESGLPDFLVDILMEFGDGAFPLSLVDLSDTFTFKGGDVLEVLRLFAD
jgi:hypothetical protein